MRRPLFVAWPTVAWPTVAWPTCLFSVVLIVVSVGAASPCFGQTDASVTTSNLTQVNMRCVPGGRCVRYEKVADKQWLERDAELAQSFSMTETAHDATTVSLADRAPRGGSADTKLSFDLKAMFMSGSVMSRAEPRVFVGASFMGNIARVYGVSREGGAETCAELGSAGQDTGARCTCDLRTLRPLQGAIGQAEVNKKREDIVAQKTTRLSLAYDPIKVIRGPAGALYVVDHHHGGKAWLDSGATMGTCVIQGQLVSTDAKQFWSDVKRANLVWLKNQSGQSITEQQLPPKLADLPDDPYRTLAWRVRKKDGFCRALMNGQTEFAEFRWADWFRARPELPIDAVLVLSKSTVTTAVSLAKTQAAASLPGYRGDKPAGYQCPAATD